MAKKLDWEANELESKVHDLAESMKRVRTAQAERDDVVVDIKNAKISRLELLADDLAEVIKAVPGETELFEFGISKGDTPRFWVDVTSFVRLVGDGREYEFVKDTHLGRVVLGRSENRETIGKHVSDYVAERILDRERAIEGEWVTAQALAEIDEENEVENQPDEVVAGGASSFGFGLLWLLCGVILGFAVVAFMAATQRLQPVIDWFNAFIGIG